MVMKQTLLLVVLALGMLNINVSAQTKKAYSKKTSTQMRKNASSANNMKKNVREYKIEHDGFEWYLISKDGKYGAESRNGSIIIPTEYTSVRYCTQGDFEYFNVKMGKYDGLYDLNGKCIIPYSRHYNFDWVLKCNDKGLGTYYRLCKWKKEGDSYIELGEVICDSKGKEIVNMQGKDIMVYPYFQNELYFYFKLKQGDKEGIANSRGDIIVALTPMEKGQHIFYDSENEYFYSRENHNKKILSRVLQEILKDNPFKNNIAVSSNSSQHSASSYHSSSSSSNSSSNNSGGGTTTIVVEQHGPVQVWVACGGCQFEPGRCTYCHGSGWGYNGRLCSRCGGNGKCTICGGNGGHYEVQYR